MPPLDAFAALLRAPVSAISSDSASQEDGTTSTTTLCFAPSRRPEDLQAHYNLLHARGFLAAPPPPNVDQVLAAAAVAAAAQENDNVAVAEGSNVARVSAAVQSDVPVATAASVDAGAVTTEGSGGEAGVAQADATHVNVAEPEAIHADVAEGETMQVDVAEAATAQASATGSTTAPVTSGLQARTVKREPDGEAAAFSAERERERLLVRASARSAASAAALIAAHPPGSFDAVQERILLDVALGKLHSKRKGSKGVQVVEGRWVW